MDHPQEAERKVSGLVTEDFDSWNLSPELLEHVVTVLPPGAHILELGSGKSTRELAKFFRITAVEDNPEYAKAPNVVFVARGESGFYDAKLFADIVSSAAYDMVVVDGPSTFPHYRNCRLEFANFIKLLKGNPYLVIDDIHRKTEFLLFLSLLPLRPNFTLHFNGKKCCALIEPASSSGFADVVRAAVRVLTKLVPAVVSYEWGIRRPRHRTHQ